MRQRIRAVRATKDGGFTLIELLITILILGVLAGIVVFSVQAFNDDGKQAACLTEKKAVEVAAEAHYAKNSRAWPANVKDLVTKEYLNEEPSDKSISIDNKTGKVSGC